jgi:hypothetical protein
MGSSLGLVILLEGSPPAEAQGRAAFAFRDVTRGSGVAHKTWVEAQRSPYCGMSWRA